MSLKLVLHKEVILDPIWGTDDDWRTILKGGQAELIAFLDEDKDFFLENCGGLAALIQSAELIP